MKPIGTEVEMVGLSVEQAGQAFGQLAILLLVGAALILAIGWWFLKD